MAYKVLFVCLGNICRSPSAENIMNYLLEQAPQLRSRIECDSAGTGGWHVGNPPDRRMAAAASKKLGITLKGAARQFQPEDLDTFDLIVAMDRDNYRDILLHDPDGHYQHKVKLMCEYCRQYGDDEVPDPYYGGAEGFNYVIDLLMDACGGLLSAIEQEQLTR
ncbi:low molecular weight protein-tyrosine-phosphatase [Leptolyngbya sp. AN02str]|uniref:low molecular weight protein-tyrosine-phosphatase n=1 Tax=Leptolyngbya sp. AN02str TaxID=3423363 RepID=UPI003D317074